MERILVLLAVMSAFIAVARASPPHRLDSIHVFQWTPDGRQNSGSAHALVWRLHHARVGHRTLKGEAIGPINEAMVGMRPTRHVPGALPDLAYVAMVYSNGRRIAFGLDRELDRLIDLTDMREFRISTSPEHERIQARLRELLEGP